MGFRDDLRAIKIPEGNIEHFDALFPDIENRLFNEIYRVLSPSYVRGKARKKPSLRDRSTPCQICGFPLSQRHHMLDYFIFGDTDSVVFLCPNCHELYHLFLLGVIEEDVRANRLIQSLLGRIESIQFCGIMYLVFACREVRVRFIESSADANAREIVGKAFQMRLL